MAESGKAQEGSRFMGGAVTVAVTLPRPMVAQLDAIAKDKNWKRSEAVREAIQLLLAQGAPPKFRG